MEWLNKMNEALNYVEDNLTQKVDFSEVARIACCSPSRFQRMFTFVTDITVTEYIRRRKMTLAAAELVDSNIKIVDLAMKYGYESPEAFTRAFQAFHGIPPTSVRKLGIYTKYPRLSFQIMINGGNFNMGNKPLVRIEEHKEERTAYFSVNCRGPEEAAWNKLRSWVNKNVSDYKARRFIGYAPKGHHPKGEAHDANEDEGFHEYIAQMFLLEDEGISGSFYGADVCDAPKGLFLVGDVVLNEFNDRGELDIGASMQNAGAIMNQCLNDMGGYAFQLQERAYYEEHIFSDEWFSNNGGLAGFKLWLPIKKV